ncbi:putative F-box domain, galactose oxidase/kelch, beta-propeller, F-box associated interaction [Rosa chinensis]|uniref:Putative F-box domain, galactose oxidase/kelch, beta-propeller, F-box associated interaction n=1 Tax=Rosa chinensis TaxID=74649 RepID=A0A2P6QHQ5_ROSCH|nr:putative F-box domain, galactose oxidase/kelch, beta-propeller, F-box associated interaction [Rosa chinensis]
MAEDGGGCKRAHTEFHDGDIISEILARLPVKSLMRFRCVSKSWSALISDPFFTKKHLSYTETGITENSSRLLYSLDPPQSLDYEALKDLKDHRDGYFANRELDLPILQPSNVLPRTKFPSYFPKFNSRHVFCGFGYDSATDDYKVIMGTRNCKQIQIFTLKTSSWKVLPLTNALDMSGKGLLLNGSLHWLAEPQPNAGNRQTILSFDLVEEKFREMIPLPHHDAYFRGMTILRNYLCVFEVSVGRDGVNTIWMMKQYGVKQSWTQVIRCPTKVIPEGYIIVFMQPICILENGELLVNDRRAGFLVLYDPKENTFKNVTKTHDQLRCGALVYRETLVSPVTGSVVDI